MAVAGNRVVAIGKNLKYDTDFKSYERIDLKGSTVLPGFVDSHTHFYFIVKSFGHVILDGLESLEKVLEEIRAHSGRLAESEWVVGEGFSPDRWKKYAMPDRFMLDRVTGGRPAAVFSKDQHTMWVNSRVLKIAGITSKSVDPRGGKIERLENNEPSGILREIPGYFPVYKAIKGLPPDKIRRFYRQALQLAYAKGITGVHSFDDGPEALMLFDGLSRKGQLGLRINYYPPAKFIPELSRKKLRFGYGNDYFRLSGVKIYADGALGSQTALCFNKYIGSKDNYGIEVTSKDEILTFIRQAARLNLPCAVHAIGDRAIAGVLDCLEKAPPLKGGARHRIEHVQLIRRADIGRLKRLKVIASMQPSHCPSDIELIEKYWGGRGRNCYLFNTLSKRNIALSFGSDAPIEPIDPISGISAAVNRRATDRRVSFYPDERISVTQAVFGFTAGPAYAVGQEHERGYLLPEYRADFIVLSDNIYHIPKRRIKDVRILATFFDGKPVYSEKNSRLSF